MQVEYHRLVIKSHPHISSYCRSYVAPFCGQGQNGPSKFLSLFGCCRCLIDAAYLLFMSTVSASIITKNEDFLGRTFPFWLFLVQFWSGPVLTGRRTHVGYQLQSNNVSNLSMPDPWNGSTSLGIFTIPIVGNKLCLWFTMFSLIRWKSVLNMNIKAIHSIVDSQKDYSSLRVEKYSDHLFVFS